MLNSIFVSLIDTAIVWILYRGIHFNLVIANSAGVITGFIIHYTLSSKSVFQTKFGLRGFFVYFITFLLGLLMGNMIILTGEQHFFLGLNRELRFLLNKGISALIPFFVLYFLRKLLFDMINSKMVDSEEQNIWQ
jgi:putative flippase GtrA